MEYVTNSAFDHLPKGIARRFDSRYDVVIRTLDDGTRTELQPMLQTPSGEYVRFEDYAKLVEKCERLTKAGDDLVLKIEWRNVVIVDPPSMSLLKVSPDCLCNCHNFDNVIEAWNAAKGGQS